MRIAVRTSNLVLIILLSLASVPTAFAQHHAPDHAIQPDVDATPHGNDRGSDSNASPGAATLAPAAGGEGDLETFIPEGNDALRDKLIAGRKTWMQKKSILDDVNAAVARAKYQKYQTGRPVDAGLLARQQEAQREAEAAHDALTPLVEEAREAGMSPRVLELYNEINQPN